MHLKALYWVVYISHLTRLWEKWQSLLSGLWGQIFNAAREPVPRSDNNCMSILQYLVLLDPDRGSQHGIYLRSRGGFRAPFCIQASRGSCRNTFTRSFLAPCNQLVKTAVSFHSDFPLNWWWSSGRGHFGDPAKEKMSWVKWDLFMSFTVIFMYT